MAPPNPPRSRGIDPSAIRHRLVFKLQPRFAHAPKALKLLEQQLQARVDSLFEHALEHRQPRTAVGKRLVDLFDRVKQVDLPGATPATLQHLASLVRRSGIAEYVHLEPLGVPPPAGDGNTGTANTTPTPDFTGRQLYRTVDLGMGVDGLAPQERGGDDVRVAAIEYGWDLEHEELRDAGIAREPGQTIAPEVHQNGWDHHGTATVSMLKAGDNGFGVTGMAGKAQVTTFGEWTVEGGYRRASALASAIAASRPGDVLMLEMQTIGPNGNYVPAEFDPVIFDLVKQATQAGIIVVAAAGNGGEDLDAPDYAEYRARGDSGAILVGGGTADAQHNREVFSSFGTRVNLQGYGEGVVTAGYGDLAKVDENLQRSYTGIFNGTSSALPCVVTAAVLVQAYAKKHLGRPLTPAEMRSVLSETGKPQGTDEPGHVGPLPNVPAAIQKVREMAFDAALSEGALDGTGTPTPPPKVETEPATSATPASPAPAPKPKRKRRTRVAG